MRIDSNDPRPTGRRAVHGPVGAAAAHAGSLATASRDVARASVSIVNGEHPNATAYRRAAEAFRLGDETELRSLVAPDVVWHVPGDHPMAGEVHGLDALLAWLGRARAKGFWLGEHDVFGNDEHVCALSVMGARRPGIHVQTRVVSVFQYWEGQQLEGSFYPRDGTAWERIFTDQPKDNRPLYAPPPPRGAPNIGEEK
jgi:uncharacterized protein